MTNDPETELNMLIDDVDEINKVVVEMKAARAERREPSAEVLSILDRWERDAPVVDEPGTRFDS